LNHEYGPDEEFLVWDLKVHLVSILTIVACKKNKINIESIGPGDTLPNST